MLRTNRPHVLIAKFPKNAKCAVTSSWDDNDKDDMEIARMLDSLNIKGTFYIDFSNAKSQLTDSQIRTLSERHDVGSHTWSHADMRLCEEDKIRSELLESKRYLEGVTGHSVLGLAFPYGHHSHLAGKIAQECGYLFARTTELGHVDFPPSDPYSWAVSCYALKREGRPKKLISRHSISKTALVFLYNLTSKSGDLALKLFEKAKLRGGVWHIRGHADEVLQPVHREEFLKICRNLAGQEDVWYTTNSDLFQNEAVKGRVHIDETERGNRFVFRVSTTPPRETFLGNAPAPLRVVKPPGWNANFQVEVKSTRFEMGRSHEHVWIDLFDNEAQIEVTP
jgi:peptidoglycan/xylan/chitin deacetylase (PgdA/CDA1 family)